MEEYGKRSECVSITVSLVKTYLKKNSVRNGKANTNNKKKQKDK
jgi:hypothetical protein